MLTLVHAMVAGGTHIDHADMLRSGATGSVLRSPGDGAVHAGHVPSGLHLRSRPPARPGARRGAAPGLGPWGRDRARSGSSSTSTPPSARCAARPSTVPAMATPRCSATTPSIATRARTGEVLHVRMRKGAANTQRGTKRFVEELVARVRRAGATGELIMRFDSGFWSNATIATLERLDVGYTMGVRMVKSVVRAVEAIDESAWTPIDYTDGRRGRGGRVHLQGTPAHRASDPAGRTPGDPVARVASLRLPHRIGKAPRSRSTPSTGPTPPSSWPSAT